MQTARNGLRDKNPAWRSARGAYALENATPGAVRPSWPEDGMMSPRACVGKPQGSWATQHRRDPGNLSAPRPGQIVDGAVRTELRAMEELLAWLFMTAIQLSGLPALPERPEVTAVPYPALLREVCGDGLAESRRLLAEYDRCTASHAMRPAVCDELHTAGEPYAECTRQRGLMAAYLVETRRIVYRDDLNLDNDIDNSFIVHEFVHALQDHAQRGSLFDTCADTLAAERQAYAVQQAYLRSRGKMLRVGDRLRQIGCADLR